MRLEDLRKSIAQMSDEELLELVKRSREARIRPAPQQKKHKRTKVLNLGNLLSGLSPEELQQLEKILLGGEG